MESAMLCPKCGSAIAEGISCCGSCGASLVGPEGDETVALPASRLSPEASFGFGTEAIAGGQAARRAPDLSAVDFSPSGDFGPRYRIERFLGEGGMGKVYKAFDKELGRTVALKMVRPEYAANPDAMRRFKRELLLASSITHKNVLRIHDMGNVGGIKFITMAYVDGPDLLEVIKKAGRMPPDRIAKIGRQLCAALDAAQEIGVVHRDLKPQN